MKLAEGIVSSAFFMHKNIPMFTKNTAQEGCV